MTKPNLHILCAQLNPTVGATAHNLSLVLDAIEEATNQSADLLVFPELMLTGYPPEDILLRESYLDSVDDALEQVIQAVGDITVVIGHPMRTHLGLCNALSVIRHSQVIGTYVKQHLPNTQVFDERRYFIPGRDPFIVECRNTQMGLLICEDIWHAEPVQLVKEAGADFILVINASPFSQDKLASRHAMVKAHAKSVELPILYVNMVGGQDELVFDGGSFMVDASGDIIAQAPQFESLLWAITPDEASIAPTLDPDAQIYQALVLGVRDYYHKNGFKGIVLGLSGGIDSALTLAIAADAVGSDKIEVLLMPSRYTRELSNQMALEQAKSMGVKFDTLSIEASFEGFLSTLANRFKDTHPDITEQNIQARCRGILVMAVSNKTGFLVLTTGNKSEYAVGYATLYGDMCGGYAPLKDVYKTKVYELAYYRNNISPVIPQAVIDRAPSAELAHEQLDVDSLPEYPLLDEILFRHIEAHQSVGDIVADGFPQEIVERVLKLLYQNEYKRRQSPPGPKVTVKAFGRDRRYPMTSGFKGE